MFTWDSRWNFKQSPASAHLPSIAASIASPAILKLQYLLHQLISDKLWEWWPSSPSQAAPEPQPDSQHFCVLWTGTPVLYSWATERIRGQDQVVKSQPNFSEICRRKYFFLSVLRNETHGTSIFLITLKSLWTSVVFQLEFCPTKTTVLSSNNSEKERLQQEINLYGKIWAFN